MLSFDSKDVKEILKNLAKDSNFLAEQGLMDYSLLLIVEDSKHSDATRASALDTKL